MLMRANSLKSEGLVSSVFNDMLSLFVADDIYDIVVTGLRHAAEGSDVTVPATYSGTSPFGTGSAVDTDQRAKTWSFTGRDLTGHKNKVFVFGAKYGGGGDYRIDPTENARISDILDYLNALNGFFITINGEPTIFNLYANIGFNDHWIKKARG